jgi:phage shock protein A
MPRPMLDESALAALDRIERALARVEAAATASSSASGTGADEELQSLREAHRGLRSRVAGAIGQIDSMLADGPR